MNKRKKIIFAAILSVTMIFNSLPISVNAQTETVSEESISEKQEVENNSEMERIEETEDKKQEESNNSSEQEEQVSEEVQQEEKVESDGNLENTEVESKENKIQQLNIQPAAEVFADWEYEIKENEKTIVLSKYKGTGASVVVPSEFDGYSGYRVVLKDKTVFGQTGSKGKNAVFDYITSIKIGTDSNKKVGILSDDMGYMFSGDSSNTPSNLVSIDLSCFDTSNVTNMERLFNYGKNLTNINFKGINTTNVTNMMAMFQYCTIIEQLDLSSFNTSNVTTMKGMFTQCYKLQSVNLSNFDTSKVTDMYYMFNRCNSLVELDLKHFNVKNVTTMYCMFNECTSIKSIDLSGWKADRVTTMQAAFSKCINLENLNLTEFSTKNVTNIGAVFNECSKLKKVDLSGFSTENVTDMKAMFQKCYLLEEIQFSNNFSTNKVENMSYMFNQCNKLKKLDLSHFDTTNVTNMSAMFQGCDSLSDLDLSHFNTSNVTDFSYMVNNLDNLISLDISSFDTTKATTMQQMVQGLAKLESLNLGNITIPTGANTTGLFNGLFTQSENVIVFAQDNTIKTKLQSVVSSKKPYSATVTYHGNGGIFDTDVTEKIFTITSDKVIYDDVDEYQTIFQKNAEEIASKYVPRKSGHGFAGWYLDSECKNPLDKESTIDFTLSENKSLQLYASWVERPLLIVGGTEGTDWTYQSGVVNFIHGGNYVVKGKGVPTTDRIVVQPGFNGKITLENVNIDVSDQSNVAAIFLKERENDYSEILPASIEIELTGTNILKSAMHWAGLTYNNGNEHTRLTISGDGSLEAYGGENAAGIGCSNGQHNNNITIKGGTVKADRGIKANVIIDGGVIESNLQGSTVLNGGSIKGSIDGNATISGGYISGNISGDVKNQNGEKLYRVDVKLDSPDFQEILIDGSKMDLTDTFQDNPIHIYVTKDNQIIKVKYDGGIVKEYGTKVNGDGSANALLNNRWTKELDLAVSVISYGEELQPTVEALYGNNNITYVYSNTENGSYEKEMPKNVGTYWIKAIVDKTDEYWGLESTPKQFTIIKADANIDLSLKDNKTEYEFEDIIELNVLVSAKSRNIAECYIAVFIGDNQITDATEIELNHETTITIDTNNSEVKKYLKPSDNEITLTIRYGGTTNLNEGIESFNIKLKKKDTLLKYRDDLNLNKSYDTQKASLDKTTDIIKNGSSQDVQIVWKTLDGTLLGEAPSVSGDYKVVISVEGDTYYNGVQDVEKEFTISKAQNTWTEELSINGWTYNEKANEPSAKAQFGDVTFTYSSEEKGAYTSEEPKNAGTWYVKANVKGTENYNGLESTPIKFEITKATSTIKFKDDVTFDKAYDAKAVVVTEEHIEKSGSTGAVQFTFEKKVNDEWKATTAPTEAGTYRVTATLVGDNNYNSQSVALGFDISKAQNTWIDELSIDGWTYNEKANEPSAKTKFGNVEFTYSANKDGEFTTTVPTNAGTYYVKAAVTGTENYDGLEKVAEFKIAKADPVPDKVAGLVIRKGDTLSTVQLPNGFSWKDGNLIADTLGSHSFKAIFTPKDTENYNTVEVDIELKVVPKPVEINHAPIITAEDVTLTVGDEFEPLKGVAATDLEDGDKVELKVIKNTVDTKKAGTYTVTYQATDSEGASVTKTVTIMVNKGGSKITITTKSLDKVYDGQVVSNPEYKTSGSDAKVTITWQKNTGTADTLKWEDLKSAPSTVGTYRVVVELTGNDNYNSASAALDFTISKTDNAWTEKLSITGWTYNEKTNVPTAKAKFGDVVFTYSSEENGTYTSEVPKNAGTYYVKATVAGTENYTRLESVVSFNIAKADTTLTFEKDNIDKTYDKNAISEPKVNKTGSSNDITFSWFVANGNDWKQLDNAPSDVGKYKVVAGVTEDTNYKEASEEKEFSIRMATNEWTKELSINDWTYGENASVPSAMAKFGDVVYTYSDSKDGAYTNDVPANAGTWYVKASVAGTTNYTSLESEPVSFEIKKANSSIKFKDGVVLNKAYDTNAVVVTEEQVEKTGSTGTVSFTFEKKVNDEWKTVETATEVGTYRVTATLSDDNNHNSAASKPLEFLIRKADSQVNITTKTLDKVYDGQTVSNPEYTTSGSDGKVTITWQKNTGTKENPKWEDLKSAPSTVGTYRVVVELAGNDNYNSASDSLEFVISQAKNAWTKELSITGWIYNEKANAPTAKAQFGDVVFTYSSEKNGTFTNEVPKNAGTYYVKATVAETEIYAGLEAVVSFEIAKVIPIYEKVTGLLLGQGQPLSKIELPEQFKWVDDTLTADELGTHTFKAIYTPEDTANYQTIEVEIEVEVVATPVALNYVPTINANNKTIAIGDKFDPLKDVTATDKEDGDLTSKIKVINHTVDTKKAGTYEVTYQVIDSQGATVTKTIKVTVKAVPINQDKDKPSNNKPGNDKESVETGDQTNVGLFISLSIISALAIAILAIWKKRKSLEDR